MAFADYFSRNITSASQLLARFDPGPFRDLLDRETIGIAYDDSACQSAEGKAALDLTIRLLSRLYPNIALLPQGRKAHSASTRLEKLAKEINPALSVTTTLKSISRCVVIGSTDLRTTRRTSIGPIYIGSDNWIALLSRRAPVDCGKSNNPLGAGAASCLGAANLFRKLFAKQLPGSTLDNVIRLSLLDLNPAAAVPLNPSFTTVDIGEAHLVGAGAIGNGCLWAFSKLPARGVLHVIDHESIDLSNMQRYVMTRRGDEKKQKATLAQSWISGSRRVAVHPHPSKWSEYLDKRNDFQLNRVLVAVDSKSDRINIQASLPRWIINGWTQGGEAGISHHDFIGYEACLACLYMPRGSALNEDEIIRAGLRLPDNRETLMQVRQRLDTAQPTDRAFLELIAKNATIPIDKLLPFESQPLRSFYQQAVCAGKILEFSGNGGTQPAEVPMAFQSAFAGIVIAAETIAHAAELRKPAATITQIDMLRKFPVMPSHYHRKDKSINCLCNDQVFIDVFNSKYKVATAL